MAVVTTPLASANAAEWHSADGRHDAASDGASEADAELAA